MAGIAKKSFEAPDERRTPDKTEVQVSISVRSKPARMTLQPGWRWSECIKPIAVPRAARRIMWGRWRLGSCGSAIMTARKSRSARATPM